MFGSDLGKYLQHTTAEMDMIARVTQHPERPKPLREYDQIYMLPGSQLSQAKLISDYLRNREVVLVGDGDCMSLVLAFLAKNRVIDPPAHMLVLDFDERILHFIKQTVAEFKLDADLIDTRRYNVRHPIPSEHAGESDVFYTNPPYGSADKGECGKIFLSRCMALCKPVGSWGVAILPYQHSTRWSREAMANIQPFLVQHGYIVTEMIRGVHQYHLEDRPELYSGTVVVDRVNQVDPPYSDRTFQPEDLQQFYGRRARRMPEYIDEQGNSVYAETDSTPTEKQRRSKRERK